MYPHAEYNRVMEKRPIDVQAAARKVGRVGAKLVLPSAFTQKDLPYFVATIPLTMMEFAAVAAPFYGADVSKAGVIYGVVKGGNLALEGACRLIYRDKTKKSPEPSTHQESFTGNKEIIEGTFTKIK